MFNQIAIMLVVCCAATIGFGASAQAPSFGDSANLNAGNIQVSSLRTGNRFVFTNLKFADGRVSSVVTREGEMFTLRLNDEPIGITTSVTSDDKVGLSFFELKASKNATSVLDSARQIGSMDPSQLWSEQLARFGVVEVVREVVDAKTGQLRLSEAHEKNVASAKSSNTFVASENLCRDSNSVGVRATASPSAAAAFCCVCCDAGPGRRICICARTVEADCGSCTTGGPD